MKILILSHTFPLNPTDSTAHFMLDFAEGFAQLGHEVFVLVPFHPKLKPQSFARLNVIAVPYIWPKKWHLLGYSNTLINDQQLKWSAYFLFPFYFICTLIALFNLLKKEKFDRIFAHWVIPDGFIAALVIKIFKTPLFITIPGSDAYLANKNKLFQSVAQFSLSSTTKVISNSPQLLKDLNVKGEVISYGVPINTGKRVVNKKLVIATAGRRVEKKGFEILQRLYPDIEILSGLSIDQFRKKLLGIDIFIALSIRDKKGNLDDASLVVLEAMAAGCAVITSDLQGYRKVINNRANGLLVDPGNEKELLAAVSKLTKSEPLRKKISQAARQTIAENFTPEKIARQYLDLL